MSESEETITTPKPCSYFYQIVKGKKVYPHKENNGEQDKQS
jgi:hypothetical protein